MQRLVSFIVVLVCAGVLSGCGGGGGRDYKIKADQQATISGTVKFGEKNVPVNAQVTFFNSEQGIAAVGFADESGNFALKPAEKETGLPAGKYQVRAKYFASDTNRASARTKVYATITRDFGEKTERTEEKVVTLETGKDLHDLVTLDLE